MRLFSSFILPAILLLPPIAGTVTVPAFSATAEDPAGQPLSLLVTSVTDSSGAVVTLTFSRRVEYRLEEARSRLRLVILEPLSDDSMVDRDLDGNLVKRIRFDTTTRGTDVVFYLGRAFATFSSAELNDPFRVTLQFQREGALPSLPPRTAPGETEPSPLPPDPLAGAARNEDTPRSRIVVIDPGHGGSEEGAVSRSGLKEKDLVLDIARQLRARLQETGFSVTLTREEDQSLPLIDRTALANQAGAGLFVSIHANSSMRPSARGAETYFLAYGDGGDGAGARGDEQAMSVARRENMAGAGDPGGGSQSARPEIRAVLWEMAQAEHLSASSRLAEMIQTEMNDLADVSDRGVKQAPFRVLVGAAMPAVLVEVGFLTHAEEEKKLATQEYRDRIAQALAAAISRFTQDRERDEGAPTASGREPR